MDRINQDAIYPLFLVKDGVARYIKTDLLKMPSPERKRNVCCGYRDKILYSNATKLSNEVGRNTTISSKHSWVDTTKWHAYRVTQKFLTDQQVQFLRTQQWMPNSPDAAPCDCFLWGQLKNKLNKRRVSTLMGLQKAIREEVKKIPQGIILRALKSWPKCCRQIYYAEGRHIEKHR
ncbi:hypothetical protein AVEN_185836-1 [Araneus ventricosus]|uniref:Uncharacterized protein n=1 Tax=Araneus ventricosus TaxID=182803 RepID=A0A4Y2NFV4_ARAVE|nr:hypothetical protein AVEN_185836-1 [Araneus ventricosus]